MTENNTTTKSKDWMGNGNSIWMTLGASNHTPNERQGEDFYATDPIAVDKLLTVERPYNHIWEPACGEGHLSDRLSQHGFTVYSTDLWDRGYAGQSATCDFLQVSCAPVEKCDILTNPPYKYAREFVLKALELLEEGRKVYMLLKLTFLEGQKRYKTLFSKYPPQTIYVFSERVMCAKNAEFDRMKEGGGSAVAYAWYVWEKGYTGTTSVKWI